METPTTTAPAVQQADSIRVDIPLHALDTPVSVQTFMGDNNLVQVNRAVGINTNGYPFVTFINGENRSANIYFSKEAAKLVSAGQPLQKGFFDDLRIMNTYNKASGASRIKLCRVGESPRLDAGDLF